MKPKLLDVVSVVSPLVAMCCLVSLKIAQPKESEPTRIVHEIQPNYPTGKCFEYAIKLQSELSKTGLHGRLVFYAWQIVGTSHKGSHVFVDYRDGDREYISDNEHQSPVEVPAGSPDVQLVYLLGADKPAPVEVKLSEGMNHLSYF